MKRIIALLLAVLSLFAFVACKKNEPTDDLAPFKAALGSAPVSATVASKIENTSLTLEGEYNVSYAAGVATVTFTNEVLVAIPENGSASADAETLSGSATVNADGTVSQGAIGANYAALIARKITLDKSKMTACSVAGQVLIATISADNATSLTAGHANTDVTLNVTIADGKLMGISVSYGTASGNVSIVCDYRY